MRGYSRFKKGNIAKIEYISIRLTWNLPKPIGSERLRDLFFDL